MERSHRRLGVSLAAQAPALPGGARLGVADRGGSRPASQRDHDARDRRDAAADVDILWITTTGVEPLDTIGGDNDFGDGIVPLAGAIGHDLPMDTNIIRRIVDQHGNLQNNPWALDELEEILTTTPVRRRAGATIPIQVTVPDLILASESLPVVVDIEADRPPAVRIQLIAESATGEREKIAASRTPTIRHSHIATSFTGLAPGAYEIRVTGLDNGSPITPVTAPVLVWTPQTTL
ncbi:MAG: hypothetical protein ACRDRU_14870 [Pseudonocardiaceae bacterium]